VLARKVCDLVPLDGGYRVRHLDPISLTAVDERFHVLAQGGADTAGQSGDEIAVRAGHDAPFQVTISNRIQSRQRASAQPTERFAC
jgi:hypothetical protein